ncbi:glycosyl hydrolase family 18 protein [Brevibacillus reuszeri]|uniref:glycosyl hydrolase family 18 protein n=1 Tax=Brevibacillus reuszeri TaxID=54915 RepID=UPI0028A07283|nr:glycosyl hydrolase family 18 protein [Brevibacillus reuszeri]
MIGHKSLQSSLVILDKLTTTNHLMKGTKALRTYRFVILILLLLFLSSCHTYKQSEQNQQANPKSYQIDGAGKAVPERIVMGWNAFGTTDTYIEQNHVSPNLNVVSPRWLSLDSEHLITGEVDPAYVEWAHQSGKQVWVFLGNQFDPELTDKLLSDKNNHVKMAEKLEKVFVEHKIDGINVDFENIKMENKGDFVSFVQQLKKSFSPHGIIVSVDITRENPDPYWSGSYDRAELGKIADYIIMMGYDEDLGAGEKVGSVASLPWVEEGIQLLIKDVPPSKVILAVPFYMREWVTNLKTKKETRYDRNMLEGDEIIKDKGLKKKWDKNVKQNYVEFVENDEKHQIWLEDKESLQQRVELVNKYDLKGTAAWFIGQETPEIWPIFH